MIDPTSLFLAKVFGLYLTILSIFLLARKESFVARVHQVLESPAVSLFSAILTLIIGILLVVSHNLWLMHWPVLITLLSWWILLNGILRLFFPEIAMRGIRGFLKNRVYYPVAIFALLLGIFFLCVGYI